MKDYADIFLLLYVLIVVPLILYYSVTITMDTLDTGIFGGVLGGIVGLVVAIYSTIWLAKNLLK